MIPAQTEPNIGIAEVVAALVKSFGSTEKSPPWRSITQANPTCGTHIRPYSRILWTPEQTAVAKDPLRSLEAFQDRSRMSSSRRPLIPSNPPAWNPSRFIQQAERMKVDSQQLKEEPGDESMTARIASIDALRGFDMFWIIGGDAFCLAILSRLSFAWAPFVALQLEHVPWQGFRFYDLIFPLFLFLVGCVLPFSLDKYRSQPRQVYLRILRRTLALIALGLIANGLLDLDFRELRWAGVLQRIGVCYGCAALIYVHCKVVGQSLACVALLVGYWALLSFVPVPGGLAGDMTIEGNLAGWIDRNFLPGKILEPYYGYGDNEGILSTLPAMVTVLLGGLTGRWLKSTYAPWQKLLGMVAVGCSLLMLGYVWGNSFPIIKNLWTSSFVLVAAGWSLLLLSLFYGIMDVAGYTRWALPFTVIGMNAITIYFCQEFIDFEQVARFYLTGIAGIMGDAGNLVLLAGTLAAKLLFLWFLYSKRVFFRV